MKRSTMMIRGGLLVPILELDEMSMQPAYKKRHHVALRLPCILPPYGRGVRVLDCRRFKSPQCDRSRWGPWGKSKYRAAYLGIEIQSLSSPKTLAMVDLGRQ